LLLLLLLSRRFGVLRQTFIIFRDDKQTRDLFLRTFLQSIDAAEVAANRKMLAGAAAPNWGTSPPSFSFCFVSEHFYLSIHTL
jgi:hypothetical protein